MPRILLRTIGVLLIACLLQVAPAQAAEGAAAGARPKICLVLSGGSARGAAHVGVLLALEKLRIPVDCIAGASIGASIGGLYAAGMTPEDLQQVLNRPDVQADMADNTPRSSLSYQEKQDQLKYLLRVEFGYDGSRFFFPQGLINGNDPSRILNVLNLALESDNDFDKLPIPFRAVATDVETGDEVVLDHGSLADVLRASMAVPSVYPPVRIDNRLLIDGGVTQNLPVEVARQLGADIIIAVNISSPLSKGSELNDVFSLSLQVVKIFSNQNVAISEAKLGSGDVLIEPELGDISATDFTRMGEAITIGEQQSLAALSKHPELQLSPQAYADYRDIHRRVRPLPQRVDFVDVSGNLRVSTDLIRARFGVQPGSPWDAQAVNDGLHRLYDLGYFQRVDVTVMQRDGQTGLQLQIDEKDWQPNYVQFGLHLADDFEGDSSYELLGSYTRADVNELGAEWRNQFEIGKTRLYYTELYQPVRYAGDFFVAPQVEYLNQTFDVFSGKDRIAEYSTVFPHAGVDMGFNVDNDAQGRVGLMYGHVVSQPRIGAPTLPSYRNTLSGPRVLFGLDTFDSAGFPSSGSYVFINGFFPRYSLGSDIAYSKLDITGGQAFGNDRNSLLLLAEAGSDMGSNLPAYEQFSLGGFLSLAGLRQSQLRGDKIFDAHLVYAHHAYQLPVGLGNGLYFGAGLDAGNVWNNGQNPSVGGVKYGAALFVGADSLLGPLYLGVGIGPANNRTWFLFLGIPINGNTLAPSFGN